jgi:cytochrome c biogenesis protein CcdA/peroxiredoxin
MLILILFAFIGGVITVLSPCILPLLPIILSSSAGTGKKRPLGIVAGFILSFTFFTLFLSTIVQATGIPANALRNISVVILIVFGLTLIIPKAQAQIEKLFVYFTRFTPNSQNKTGFSGGLVVGASLGLLWTPCVGPILASVISLAISGEVSGSAFFITLAYSLGTAIPMFLIIRSGQGALQNVPWLVRNSGKIQKTFGALMIITAFGIYANIDRSFQTWFLTKFPQYGTGLTAIEDNEFVQNALNQIRNDDNTDDMIGKPMNELLNDNSYPTAPEIVPGGKWFNSQPLTISELTAQDKVVLVDFWTYSCINCIRTLPYLRDWWEKYEDDGLVIIGVHAPEFEFEKDADNLQEAIDDFELKYPIVQDNEHATWRAYKNRFWPAKYLIDKDGKIRYTHFGEGKYDETEQMIQMLLKESGKEVTESINTETYDNESRTPEIYLGTKRFNGAKYVEFEGDWLYTEEYAESSAGAEINLRYYSRDVFLVMQSDTDTQVNVYLDGELIDTITVNGSKLYDLVKLEEGGEHDLRLEFLDNGTHAFAFTFG